jgi:hypothetical protein
MTKLDMYSEYIKRRIFTYILCHKGANEVPEAVVSALAPRSPVTKQAAIANWHALNGRFDEAACRLGNILAVAPDTRGAATSLGFLLGHRKINCVDKLWTNFRHTWAELKFSQRPNIFRTYLVGLEMLFLLEPADAEQDIKDRYFPFFAREQLKDSGPEENVLYWHVPKSGGTSVSSHLSKEVYESGMDFVPSYSAKHTLSWIVQNQDGLFPYLSSAHLSAEDLGVQKGSGYKELLVVRDPVARAMSAWRQYTADPAGRFWVLPQHGHVWDFFPVGDLDEWARRAPHGVVNAYQYAFGTTDRLREVDRLIPIEHLSSRSRDIFAELGVQDEERTIWTSRNVTRKGPTPSQAQVEILRAACSADADLVRALES